MDNPLGTSGRLVQAFAKLLNEMWNQDDSVVRPTMFKRIIGEYAQQFQGYGQHDSQECINSILDLLSEDLYRKQKKPYVEMTEANGRQDAIASREAWLKHLVRNESVIVDLFHGQYKSTLVCSICDKVSVTFDPFMTLSLPIPGQKQKFSFFYIPYTIEEGYSNFKGEVAMRETDSIRDFRALFAKKYEKDEGSFIVSMVSDNMFKKMLDQHARAEEMVNSGYILLYEINPALNPVLPTPEASSKSDSNYGIADEWTKTPIYMMTPQRNQYSSYVTIKASNIPRLVWLNKNWSLHQVHLEVFRFFRYAFSAFYTCAGLRAPFRGQSIDEAEAGKALTKEQYEALSLEEAFAASFPLLQEDNWKNMLTKNDLELGQMMYSLRVKNLTGYMEPCHFCGDKRCEGCPLPFQKDLTFGALMEKIRIT